MTTGQTVIFGQGDADDTKLIGIVTRVWGKDASLVTIRTEGRIAGTTRTYVRSAATVVAV